MSREYLFQSNEELTDFILKYELKQYIDCIVDEIIEEEGEVFLRLTVDEDIGKYIDRLEELTRKKTDKELEAELEHIHNLFDEWIDNRDNLLEVPIKEALGDAFYDAYYLGLKEGKQ